MREAPHNLPLDHTFPAGLDVRFHKVAVDCGSSARATRDQSAAGIGLKFAHSKTSNYWKMDSVLLLPGGWIRVSTPAEFAALHTNIRPPPFFFWDTVRNKVSWVPPLESAVAQPRLPRDHREDSTPVTRSMRSPKPSKRKRRKRDGPRAADPMDPEMYIME